MSKQRLVEAYLRGDISRRRFVRRLVGLGLSVSAAVAYAKMAPETAAQDGQASEDHHDHYGAFPTSKEQCKNGGWRKFGFKNQGQCVAFVERGPKPKGMGSQSNSRLTAPQQPTAKR